MNIRWSVSPLKVLWVGVILVVVAGSVAAQAPPAPPAPVTAEQVDAAIEKGIKYLWSLQQPTGLFGTGMYHLIGQGPDSGNVPGGDEVIIMTTLAYVGEPLKKPEMMKGLKALMELPIEHTYALGFRIIALAELYRRTPEEKMRSGLRQAMKQDAAKLVEFQIANGGWDYGKIANGWDFSNTQLAVLGLQQAASCGVEIKPEVMIKVLELYLSMQGADGGWGYGRPGHSLATTSYGSMTAAATASLFLLRDMLNPGAGCPCKGDVSSGRRMTKVEDAAKRGTQWLGDNFAASNPHNPNHFDYYWLYAVERVGIATGFKYLGRHDWYAEGAAAILKGQAADGSFTGRDLDDTIVNTTLGLLFLIKGRGPILMNKLQFDGEWDRHPHDAERLAEYVGTLKEQRFNWQVINLDAPVEEMHDAPILYISAETPLKLTADEKKKLRAFTDSGGTILFEASCGNRRVDLAWKATCKEIWPEWELGMLDKDHPLWTADAKIVANRPPWQAASDGVRTFLFFSPRDVSCAWNTQAVVKNQSAFDLGGNLYAYTTDRGKLRSKLAVRETGPGKKYADQALSHGAKDSITVARVKHGGDWYVGRNYQPWPLLASQFEVQSGMAAPGASGVLKIKEIEPVAPGDAIAVGTNLLYLSGRTGCELGANGGKWLKDFVTSGGFLFAEAVLGDKRFDEAAKTALAAAGFTLKPLATDSPLLTGQMENGAKGYNITKVGYSFALRTERVGQPSPLLLGIYDGDKLVGLYSPFDVMFSQTGSSAFGNRGYAPDDAKAIAANIVLLASQGTSAAAPPKVAD